MTTPPSDLVAIWHALWETAIIQLVKCPAHVRLDMDRNNPPICVINPDDVRDIIAWAVSEDRHPTSLWTVCDEFGWNYENRRAMLLAIASWREDEMAELRTCSSSSFSPRRLQSVAHVSMPRIAVRFREMNGKRVWRKSSGYRM